MAERLPSGSYRKRVTYNDNGVRKSMSFTAPTAQEADYMALEFKLGKKRMSDKGNWTVSQAVRQYIDSNDSTLSPSTIRSYNGILRGEMNDIGSVLLKALDNDRLQKWVNGLARTRAPKTVANAWHLLSAVLSSYMPEQTFHVRLPQKRVTEVRIPQEEEVALLLEETCNTDLYLPLLLASQCGLRRSEICALRWQDIDMERRVIHVRGAVVRGEEGWERKATKSTAGYRTVDMTDAIYDALSTADRSAAPITVSPSKLTERFHNLCKRLGMDFHLHLLRHYYCSVLALSGIPMQYTRKLMGHSGDDLIRKVYAHTLDSPERQFRKTVVDAFNRGTFRGTSNGK